MKSRYIKILGVILIIIAAVSAGYYFWQKSNSKKPGAEIIAEQRVDIEKILSERREGQLLVSGEVDPFGKDGIVRILLIGLDSRIGQSAGHCDAIQMIEVNKKNNTVQITAVPRGTYVPLTDKKRPVGDYYVSNSCAIEGLDYGINQIQKILGIKADYLVIVGFSEVMGIVRDLKLPSVETLQWLRQRQGYAIGEPQRARNHSTFLKQMLIKFVPEKDDKLDSVWQYLLYSKIKTDLSFSEVRNISAVLSQMKLKDNPSRVALSMRPAYNVKDIPFDSEKVGEYLHSMIDPIKKLLTANEYSEKSQDQIEADLMKEIDDKKDDPEFLKWVFDNKIWLQFEEVDVRLGLQYNLISRYAKTLPDAVERLKVLEDYALEMEYTDNPEWNNKAKILVENELTD